MMKMKKETLARFIVIGLVLIAVAVPLGGKLLAIIRDRANTIDLHASTPENGGWSVDKIQVGVGQPLHLHMTSDDVVHGFAIGKSDRAALEILPSEYVDTTLTFDKTGTYTFYCTHWCGPNHWRMRGTIEVTGSGPALALDPVPLYVKLGINIDLPKLAGIVPSGVTSAERGAKFVSLLPAYVFDKETYQTSSPASLFLRLRAESTLKPLSDADLWDVIAWIWQNQSTPTALAEGQSLFSANCASCHGESGQGNGVMVLGLPVWNPGQQSAAQMQATDTGQTRFRPPDFTNPQVLLGASPALLEGKITRGGMGTGMPYWGPILTQQQIDSLVDYLYSLAWRSTGKTPQ
jgi:mono/diheme cytochrome c family protein/plastocyanin